jgi:hypothetical protein
MSQDQIQTGSILLRGRSQKSIDLIDTMFEICKETQPITGRGIGYKLFSAGLIPSMHTREMAKVYRLLRIAREEETIPWEWIVDETRAVESVTAYTDPEEYVGITLAAYRRDFWQHQPKRVLVVSEKGTVRGVLKPVLDKWAAPFLVMHGFSGATTIYDMARDDDGRELVVLYVGDYDPSGMYMSERDLPDRLIKYGGYHIDVRRIAVNDDQIDGVPSFPASSKCKDPRYKWFVEGYGDTCWELDALDPRDLRDEVDRAIQGIVDLDKWSWCEKIQAAEEKSLGDWMKLWPAVAPKKTRRR